MLIHHDGENNVPLSICFHPLQNYAPVITISLKPLTGYLINITLAIKERIMQQSHIISIFLSPTPANLSMYNTPFNHL